MWTRNDSVSAGEQDGLGPSTGPMARPARGETLACCGVPMEPELAQARDREGRKLFVAIWRCPRCARTTLK